MREVKALSFCLLCVYLLHLAAAQGSNSSKISWKTLSGDAPLVVAHGGFSGLFASSSLNAYTFVGLTSLPNTILWCDVQLTKDGAGICFPDLNLQNSSNIDKYFPDRSKKYLVNGVEKTGYFPVDFTLNDLINVSLVQGIYSRPERFDTSNYPILLVEDVAGQVKPPGFWLNIQHDAFFTQHNLSMRSYVLSISRSVVVNYISSPEVNFLKSITSRFNPKVTKLVFRFLQKDDIEPSTNQTYDAILTNLTFIKTFASGIIVPKTYIWPVDESLYLQSHTSVVADAHKEGLEVFASDFANDFSLSYNYSYDAMAEYLNFIDNGDFSVDGVLSDHPITPSEAIDCYSHIGNNNSGLAKPLVISHYGASGDYPGCTDMAYMKAISDGVDILDCPVQMTKDGIPICLSSINLIDSTTVAQSPYSNLTKIIPAISEGGGIYTFDLMWDEIKNLTPQIFNPYTSGYTLVRNPNNRNAGEFVTLSNFLALAKSASSLSGVLIGIEHAAYLAEQGFGITDAVLKSLSEAGYDNQTAQKIMIQSGNSSVLHEFKGKNKYELVYTVDEKIRDALNSTIEEITSFADTVVIQKESIYFDSLGYITGISDIVTKLHASKLPVYVQLFRNEFVSQAWDFFSDPYVEINTYVQAAKIDGIITDFPKTAASYKKNRCLSLKVTPAYMQPVQPGGLLTLIGSQSLPPAEAPYPVLTDSDVSEAPVPPVSQNSPEPATGGSATTPSNTPSGQSSLLPFALLSTLTLLLAISLVL